MRELRKIYNWSDQDVVEIKQAAKDHPQWWIYWTNLAEAHRAGYKQTPENNYQRLHVWQRENLK